MREPSIRMGLRIPQSVYNKMLMVGRSIGIQTHTECVKYFFQKGLESSAAQIAVADAKQNQQEMLQVLKGLATLISEAAQAEEIGGEKGVKMSSLGDPLEVPPIIFNTTCNNADQKRGEKTKKT